MIGAGTEEGPEDAYRREGELEQARKGTEDVFDPEGILDEEDEEMEINSEDKETRTGNLIQDGKDIATQVNLKVLQGCQQSDRQEPAEDEYG